MTQRLILGPPKTRSDMLSVAGAAGHDDIISAIGVVNDGSRLAVRYEAKGCFQRRIPGLRGLGYARGQSAYDHQ